MGESLLVTWAMRSPVQIQVNIKRTIFMNTTGYDTPNLNGIVLTKYIQLLTHSHTMTPFDTTGKQAFWETSSGKQACNFSFTHSVFYPFRSFPLFSSNLKLSSEDCFNLDQSKICSLVMG